MSVPGHGWPDLKSLVWSATLLPSFSEPLLGIAWTLQFEMMFYAVFAVLIVNRVAGWILILGWLALIVAGHWDADVSGIPIFPSGYSLQFFFGMVAAGLVKRNRIARPYPIAALGGVLFVCSIILVNEGLLHGTSTFARYAFGISASILVAGIAAAEITGRRIGFAALDRLGNASYSLYIWQFVFIGLVWQMLLGASLERQIPHWMVFCTLAIGGIGGGLMAHYVVERPLTRLVRNALHRTPPAVAHPFCGKAID